MTDQATTQEKAPAALAVQAWNNTHRPGVPVLYWPGGDRSRPGAVDAPVSTAFVRDDGEATLRLGSRWQWVPLAHVEPHPLAPRLSALTDAAPENLDFPPPPCSICRAVVCGSAAPQAKGHRRPGSYFGGDVLFERGDFDDAEDLADRWIQAQAVAEALNGLNLAGAA